MKVRFVKYHPMFAHSVGDEVTLTAEDAKSLIESGHATPIKPEPETATLPKAETATRTKK